MTVITDVAVPAEQFALGQLFDEYPDIAIDLERIVPLREGIIPLFWVEGGEPEAIEATLRADSLTEEVTLLTNLDGRYLFEMVWNANIDALVQPLIQSGAEVLRAEGGVDRWEFRLQFDNRAKLTDFRERCQANDVDMQLLALYNPAVPLHDDEEPLSNEQFDILATASEKGYFEIPRDITLTELADLIGISPNAASQRMRRGLGTLVEAAVRAH